jgi:aryl-alcohol dehydrogenase-like predicted oxidoreductase
MITRTDWTGEAIPALGLGTWAIGGPFFAGDDALGWGETDDAVSLAAVEAGVAAGIRLFDTAQAYGTGHAEELLGRALARHPEVRVVTKIGIGIDPAHRQVLGEEIGPQQLRDGIEASRRRLGRDHIDLVLLHLNSLPVAQAAPVFDLLNGLCAEGVIGAFGWSTDFPERAAAFAERDGFVAVEHGLNVFFRADALLPVIEAHGLLSINRSPLAMGLLGGRYGPNTLLPRQDVRGRSRDWMDYFHDGRVSETHARNLKAVREVLTTDGRTLAQGALAWIWGRSDRTLPVPGFRTPEQVQDLTGALAKGPLTPDQMLEIERLIDREPEGPPRER